MNGSDFLQLDASHVPRGARADWLTTTIRRAILDGVLPRGTRLPPSRLLATELDLARGTVVEAYRRLADEALIAARPRAGSTVTFDGSMPAATHAAPVRTGAAQTGRDPTPTSRSRRDEPIDLATGLPDLTAFPRAAWLRAEREILETATARQLGYAPPAGTGELRRELSSWLRRSRGVAATADTLIVTGGVAGALSLLAQLLRSEGRTTLAVEDPGAASTRRLLGHWIPRLSPIPVDQDGLDIAALSGTDADAVLTTPAHQYPTGVVLAPERRRALIDWTDRGDRLVIEDDYDAEYRYDRRPVTALQPLAPETIAYTASLSKILAPALRLGWLVPPPPLHDRLVELRWATDLGSPALPQLVLAQLLHNGALERHLRAMRVQHRARRDAAVAAIHAHLPTLRIGGIAAGLQFVLYLPGHANDEQVSADALAAGVAVQPLSRHRLAPGRPGLVLSYAAHRPDQFDRAIRTLANVIPAGEAPPDEPRPGSP